jgi:transcriptional regulator with XRE-family HTH domain
VKFGGTLKNLRNENGFTQDELAQKLSLAKSTISLYESGKREPDYKTIKAIAEFFNVTTDYLLGASGEKTGKADIHFVISQSK